MDALQAKHEIARMLRLGSDFDPASSTRSFELEDDQGSAFSVTLRSDRELLLWSSLRELVPKRAGDSAVLQDYLMRAFSARLRFQSHLIYRESTQELGLFHLIDFTSLASRQFRRHLADFLNAKRYWSKETSPLNQSPNIPLTRFMP